MGIRIFPHSPSLGPAVRRFNERLAMGSAPTSFGIPPIVRPADEGRPLRLEHVLAVDDEGEVRGGMITLTQKGWVRGELSTVVNIQSPVSEGIINAKYSMVPLSLVRFAQRISRHVYVVGMGSASNPLPRLLVGAGWTIRAVPFYFRILNVRHCLSELQPLRRTRATRVGALAAYWSGAAAIAISALQGRMRRLQVGDHPSETDDQIWLKVRERCSFAVARDGAMMSHWLHPGAFRVRSGSAWASMLVSQLRNHAHFGNLRVATLMDVVGNGAESSRAVVALALQRASHEGCDIVVSNQLHQDCRQALQGSGFLSYKSNYLLAMSRDLSAGLEDGSILVSRQDGDGMVNLAT